MRARTLLVATAVALLAACAGVPRESDAERLARYMDYAGDPVNDFHYFGRVDGWTPLGDDTLVLRVNMDEAYLLTLAPGCFDLPFASRIRIDSRFGTTVARGDTVRVGRERCIITGIRPIDYKQMRADLRAARGERG